MRCRERERKRERCIYLGKRALFCVEENGQSIKEPYFLIASQIGHFWPIIGKKKMLDFTLLFLFHFFIVFFYKNMLENENAGFFSSSFLFFFSIKRCWKKKMLGFSLLLLLFP